MNEVAFGIGYGMGWLAGNAIIIVPIIAILWIVLASNKTKAKKKK